MQNAHIRNLDDDLMADYRAAAAANRTSLQAELQNGLLRGRPRRRLSKDELVELSRRLTEGMPVTSDSMPIIRWMRDTDDGRYLGERRDGADHP